MGCWVLGLLCCWVVGLLGCWVVGLLGCWVVGMLGCCPGVVVLLACWVVGLLGQQHSRKATNPTKTGKTEKTTKTKKTTLPPTTQSIRPGGMREAIKPDLAGERKAHFESDTTMLLAAMSCYLLLYIALLLVAASCR